MTVFSVYGAFCCVCSVKRKYQVVLTKCDQVEATSLARRMMIAREVRVFDSMHKKPKKEKEKRKDCFRQPMLDIFFG
eukprot:m.139490 g.139490  ORF g.139490 m.139490 type:complete len:77 (+) comp14016_c1_seq1:158-388(+)